jgi:hypothetical protein
MKILFVLLESKTKKSTEGKKLGFKVIEKKAL